MHGIVEVYLKGNKIVEDNNLTVDHAGEVIASFMALSPDIADIGSASSLLDSSNFTIQAISFGKDLDAYDSNAHNMNVVSQVASLYAGLPVEITTSSYSGSSCVTENGDIIYPDVKDSFLQQSTGYNTVISSLPSNALGQNLNALNYAIELGLSFTEATKLGCFGYRSAGATSVNLYDSATSTITASSLVTSNFNATSSMDYLGFCSLVSGTNSLSGLVVSGLAPVSSTNEVVYTVTIAADDVAAADLYGGIFTLGLWCIDIPESLLLGPAPFSNIPVSIKRRYKLHSKKILTKSITSITDAATAGIISYSDIVVIWRLKF
jgi:hypothetical protein